MPLTDKEEYREYMRGYMRRKRAEKRLTVNPFTSKKSGLTAGLTRGLTASPSEAPQKPTLPAPTFLGGVIPTTTEAVSPPLPPTTSTHAFVVRADYAAGSQPFKDADKKDHQGRYGNITVTRYNYKSFTIHCFAHTLALVAHDELLGNHGEKETQVRAWKGNLVRFCERHNLVLKNIKDGPWSDHVFEDASINDYLMPFVLKHQGNIGTRNTYLQADASHPGQVEVKGAESWDADKGVEWVFRKMPAQFDIVVDALSGFKDYNTNIQLHLTAIQELRDAVKELVEAVKKR